MKRIFTLLTALLLYAASVNSQVANHVVISQIYGGGGNSGATYKSDYVELFNPTASAVTFTGMSFQYAGSTGSSWSKADLTGTIQPGKYFLIQLASQAAVGADLPAADQSATSINIAAGGGKVALVSNTTLLTGSCPTGATIVDFVGYGTGTDCFEGTGPTPAISGNVLAVTRLLNGCIDANINATDFANVNANPRNSSSAANNCALLPLSFTSFNASYNGKNSQLKWTTANESNLKGFSIEKSLDGTSFNEIAFVAANNNANQNNYSLDDNNVNSGANYYRIKMVSNDGSFKYSQLFVINNKLSLQVEVFPNPATNTLTVTHSKATAGSIIRLLSIEGKQIKTYAASVGSVQSAISVSELTRGNYLLIFEGDGAKTTAKFTKL